MFRTERIVSPLPASEKPRRIMLVSRTPQRVQEMAGMLMNDGFDVFLAHQCPDREFVAQLAPDMMIYDLSAEGKAASASVAAVHQAAEQMGVARTLFLVSEPTLAACLEAGASEELFVWPGSAGEALLHVRRIVRTAADSNRSAMRKFKDLSIDTGRMAVYRDGRALRLTRTEYELLLVLLNAGGSVLSRDAITERIWGCSMFGSSNTVDVHIKTLRKKLGDNAVFPKYVATVRGAGYRLADERPTSHYAATTSAFSG